MLIRLVCLRERAAPAQPFLFFLALESPIGVTLKGSVIHHHDVPEQLREAFSSFPLLRSPAKSHCSLVFPYLNIADGRKARKLGFSNAKQVIE